MVTETVAVSEPPAPSEIVYVKLSDPTPLGVLVYRRMPPPRSSTDPLVPFVKPVMVSVWPLGSVSLNSTLVDPTAS